ncbi:hypothetical protein V1511DRAFT_503978 [Dipodascopsis uninucleata]
MKKRPWNVTSLSPPERAAVHSPNWIVGISSDHEDTGDNKRQRANKDYTDAAQDMVQGHFQKEPSGSDISVEDVDNMRPLERRSSNGADSVRSINEASLSANNADTDDTLHFSSSAIATGEPAVQAALSSLTRLPASQGLKTHNLSTVTNGNPAKCAAGSSHTLLKERTPPDDTVLDDPDFISFTTRKSKACPACRKQKIKCIMENDMPPCKRCQDRGLACSKNKTLQSVVKDQAMWNITIKQHIAKLEKALNETRVLLSLSPISVVDAEIPLDEDNRSRDTEASDDDYDVTEGSVTMPTPESLASAPIRSLYEITRLKSYRNNGDSADLQSAGIVIQPDFVARGVIKPVDAERLGNSYMTWLDHYFYGHFEKYQDFQSVRNTSTLLALCICTVAAAHDPNGSDLYEKLSRELRSLVSLYIFRPQIGVEDIRAFCVGSYWLSDMTWMLSGIGMHKAMSMQYHRDHFNQPNTGREGFVKSQLWLFLYLSHEQISLIQGVPPSGYTRDFVKWEQHMQSTFSTHADLRCCSHIDLLLILSRARELYGLDTTKPIPAMFIPQLREFNLQVDRWAALWSGKLERHNLLGNYPSEAVKLHYRFAKFYLCSHAFRGLNTSQDTGVALSRDLKDIADCAIATAFAILRSLLNSDELKSSLVGVPHYFHTMYAFAAVFLLKIATRYRQHVDVDRDLVFQTINEVVEVFASSPCARQHLVNRITRGLKEMLRHCTVMCELSDNQCFGNQPDANQRVSSTRIATQSSISAMQVPNSISRSNGALIDNDATGYRHVHAALNTSLSEVLQQPLDLENFDFLSSFPPNWATDLTGM